MSPETLDAKILTAVRPRQTADKWCSRARLMAIEDIRLMTWAVVGVRLAALCSQGVLVAGKAGWRLA